MPSKLSGRNANSHTRISGLLRALSKLALSFAVYKHAAALLAPISRRTLVQHNSALSRYVEMIALAYLQPKFIPVQQDSDCMFRQYYGGLRKQKQTAHPLRYTDFPVPLEEGAVRLGIFLLSDQSSLHSLVHQATNMMMEVLPEGVMPDERSSFNDTILIGHQRNRPVALSYSPIDAQNLHAAAKAISCLLPKVVCLACWQILYASMQSACSTVMMEALARWLPSLYGVAKQLQSSSDCKCIHACSVLHGMRAQ